MYILKNALKNLVRNKGRNLAVLLIAILTLASVTISFSIQKVSDLAIEQYRDSFGVQAKIGFNWEKMNQEHPPEQSVDDDGSISIEQNFEVPLPGVAEYENYANSSYVKRTLYHATCAVMSDSLKPVKDNLKQGEEIIDIAGMSKEELMKFFNVSTEKELEETLGGKEELEKIMDTKNNCIGSLVGFTDLSLLEDFSTGKRKLEQGVFPEQRNECIISSVFAKENNLKLGDTIFVSGPSRSMDDKEIPLTVTGIYGDYFNEATAAELGLVYGDIFTTYDTLTHTGFHYIDLIDAIFVLKNPESAKLFEQELRTKGLNEYQTLEYSTEEYENNTKPLKNISHIAEIFTLSASMIGAAVLLLITFINVRERKYEIGVLRSMGMRKSGIAKGMIYEILTLMFTAFAVSIFAGLALTKPIASALLDNLANIHVSLPVASIGVSAALAFALSIVSGLCAVFAVMRHEPMKILSERN